MSAPIARDASTKSRLPIESTSASIMRVKRGIVEMPTAIMTLLRPEPSVATTERASSSVGKASMASVKPMIAAPTLPR